MAPLVLEIGQVFGELTVLAERRAPVYPSQAAKGVKLGNRMAECVCNCGNRTTVLLAFLFSGHTSSCGCRNSRMTAERNRTHGLADSGHYARWFGMLSRCSDPENLNYSKYGGRGIAVHADWHDLGNFVSWVRENLGDCPEGHTLDRIDVDGDYEPGNVRWASRSMQAHNRRKLKGCTSQFMGVSWHVRTETWRARMKLHGREIHLGHYATEEDAARAYDAGIRLYRPQSTRWNFPAVTE